MAVTELTEQHIEDLKQRFPGKELIALAGPGPEDENGDRQYFVLRGADEPEWLRLQKDLKDDAKSGRAQKAICATCCVFPGPDEMRQVCTKYPGFVQKCAERVMELSGYEDGADEKKL